MPKRLDKEMDDFKNFNFKLSNHLSYDLKSRELDFPLSVYSKPLVNSKLKDPEFIISGSTIQNSANESIQFEVIIDFKLYSLNH